MSYAVYLFDSARRHIIIYTHREKLEERRQERRRARQKEYLLRYGFGGLSLGVYEKEVGRLNYD